MTKGKKILNRVDAYFAARAREAEEQKQSEAAASAAAVSLAQQQEMERMRAAQFRKSRTRKRLTVGQVRARQEQERRERMLRQQGAAAELRARAQARREARMLVEAFEANRRYEIDHIVSRRTNVQTREYEYKIRWRGYGPERDEWRSRSALVADGVGNMLDTFDATQMSDLSAAAASLAAASSSSSDSSGSEVSSDSDTMYSMDSADDDDDDDDDSWWIPPSNGVPVDRYDDSSTAHMCAPSLLRRLNDHSHLFDGVHSVSSLRY